MEPRSVSYQSYTQSLIEYRGNVDVTYYQLELYHEISEHDDGRSPDNDFMVISYELKHSLPTSRRFKAVMVEAYLVYDESWTLR